MFIFGLITGILLSILLFTIEIYLKGKTGHTILTKIQKATREKGAVLEAETDIETARRNKLEEARALGLDLNLKDVLWVTVREQEAATTKTS